ncbi:class I SAM-dependent methyltransferase [Hanstruepera flava]|uniref:class I SAM-dependent methyltransferase n=1 Tax=Hanstruepera flava TaxID=2930218 RepID=UPI002028CA4C|nr:class I SAM-dependent methyltransferase [Hanstruepera flava]
MKNKDSKKYYSNLKKEQILCPICDDNQFKVLANKDRYGMGVQTVICNNCSMIYINPRPTELEMNNFYKNHYRSFYESIEVPTQDYINKGPFKARASFVKDALNKYLQKSKTILDVGCAEGTLLSQIEIYYPDIQTYGIEPSIGFGEYAKQNLKGDIFIGSYQDFIKHSSGICFDVVTSTHVLEHILNPKEYLLELKKMMHKASVLYIEVPNIMNDRVNGLGAVHLGHVLSFDMQTLESLLNICGFEVVESFEEGLPALTPAMAVICKIDDNIEPIEFPSKQEILKKEKLFIQKVTWKNKKASNKFNVIQKIKNRLLG